MMEDVIRGFTEETFSDACEPIAARFSKETCKLLRTTLENPVRTPGDAAGEVVYQDGKPVGFQAAQVRQLYYRQSPIIGVVGAMLAMKEGASPALLYKLMKATITPRCGSKIFYANTARPSSMKLNRMLGVKGMGPKSCETIRFAILRLGEFVRFAARGRLPVLLARFVDWLFVPMRSLWLLSLSTCEYVHREECITAQDFDSFWETYLRGNEGLVASRTAAELNWVFAKRLQTGECRLYVYRHEGVVEGYAIFKRRVAGEKRWHVADALALSNSKKIIRALMDAAVRDLAKTTDTVFVEVVGFPQFVQKTFAKSFPFHRAAPNNTFLYKILDPNLEKEWKSNADNGWFFGPYDGDQCL